MRCFKWWEPGQVRYGVLAWATLLLLLLLPTHIKASDQEDGKPSLAADGAGVFDSIVEQEGSRDDARLGRHRQLLSSLRQADKRGLGFSVKGAKELAEQLVAANRGEAVPTSPPTVKPASPLSTMSVGAAAGKSPLPAVPSIKDDDHSSLFFKSLIKTTGITSLSDLQQQGVVGTAASAVTSSQTKTGGLPSVGKGALSALQGLWTGLYRWADGGVSVRMIEVQGLEQEQEAGRRAGGWGALMRSKAVKEAVWVVSRCGGVLQCWCGV